MTDQVRSIVWLDAGGFVTITRVQTATGAASIQADALAVSDADFNDWWEGDLNINTSPAPTSSQYPSVRQVAVLSFLCADGTIANLRIPAPSISIFLSDGVTVDQTTITTLIADCIGNLESVSGSLATSYLAGSLQAR